LCFCVFFVFCIRDFFLVVGLCADLHVFAQSKQTDKQTRIEIWNFRNGKALWRQTHAPLMKLQQEMGP
jgi:hypothetical protein